MEGENKKILPKDKNKPITSQVLEYYHQYSQNRALPKYFCGTSDSFKPHEWKKSSITKDLVEEIKPECNIVITSPTRDSLLEVSNNPPSPSSSVASNRKLEWDNGADIGYSNASSNLILQKSISLPVLNTIEKEKFRDTILRLSPEGYTSETTQVNKVSTQVSTSDLDLTKADKYLSSSPSTSSKFSKPEYVSSSSSVYQTKSIESSSSSSGTNNLLKHVLTQIGLPIAESTPIVPVTVNSDPETFFYTETPKLGKKTQKIRKQSSRKSSSDDLSTKEINDKGDKPQVVVLHATKSIVIDLPTSHDKLVQTSLPKNTSIALQTDLILQNESNVNVDDQNVVFGLNSNSDDNDANSLSSTSQTNVTSLSKCSSFEYLSGADYDRMGKTSKQETSERNNGGKESSHKLSNSENGHSSTSVPSTSSESPLAVLLTSNRSDQCIPNLQRNLDLLQRVMKSKKYDDVTKKYYLKKITKKMIDASEILNVQGFESKSVQTQSVNSQETSKEKITNESDSSSLKSNTSENSKSSRNSDKNIKRATEEKVVESPNSDDKPLQPTFTMISKQIQLQANTLANEAEPSTSSAFKTKNFVPSSVIEHESIRLHRNNLLTLTDNDLVIDSNQLKRGGSGDLSRSIYNRLDSTSPIIVTSNSNTTTSVTSNQTNREEIKNWREETTKSEQLREQKADENKEHLDDYAKKERHQQLGWIKNEINHLGKLKRMLEKKGDFKEDKTAHTALQNVLQKPVIEDMEGIKKATTVYVMTTQKFSESLSEDDSGKCSCCQCVDLTSGSRSIPADSSSSLRSAETIVDQGRTSIRRYTFDIPVECCRCGHSQSQHRIYASKIKPRAGSSSCTCCCAEGRNSVIEHYSFDVPAKDCDCKPSALIRNYSYSNNSRVKAKPDSQNTVIYSEVATLKTITSEKESDKPTLKPNAEITTARFVCCNCGDKQKTKLTERKSNEIFESLKKAVKKNETGVTCCFCNNRRERSRSPKLKPTHDKNGSRNDKITTIFSERSKSPPNSREQPKKQSEKETNTLPKKLTSNLVLTHEIITCPYRKLSAELVSLDEIPSTQPRQCCPCTCTNPNGGATQTRKCCPCTCTNLNGGARQTSTVSPVNATTQAVNDDKLTGTRRTKCCPCNCPNLNGNETETSKFSPANASTQADNDGKLTGTRRTKCCPCNCPNLNGNETETSKFSPVNASTQADNDGKLTGTRRTKCCPCNCPNLNGGETETSKFSPVNATTQAVNDDKLTGTRRTKCCPCNCPNLNGNPTSKVSPVNATTQAVNDDKLTGTRRTKCCPCNCPNLNGNKTETSKFSPVNASTQADNEEKPTGARTTKCCRCNCPNLNGNATHQSKLSPVSSSTEAINDGKLTGTRITKCCPCNCPNLNGDTTQAVNDGKLTETQKTKCCPCNCPNLNGDTTQAVNDGKLTETQTTKCRPSCKCKVNGNKATQVYECSPRSESSLDVDNDKSIQTPECCLCSKPTVEETAADKVVPSIDSSTDSFTNATLYTLTENYSSSSTYSDELCECCKKCNVTRRVPALISKNEAYSLCDPCYNVNKNSNSSKPLFSDPEYVCGCYVQGKAVEKMRTTIQELEELERQEDYCKCSFEKAQSSLKYCAVCNCKTKRKNSSRGGLAYLLTLESDDTIRENENGKHKRILKEIKVKVPSSSYNHRGRSKAFSDDTKGYEHDDKKNERKHDKKRSSESKHMHKYKIDNPTLRDYLNANKPDFVTSAEERRKCLLELAYMREQRCEKYKQLLALANGCENPRPRPPKITLFSSEEMKKITEKNYKKLPEVQQKLVDERDKRIKKANKMLADIFNHKLREQTLKGKVSLPTTTSIIKF